MAYDSVCVPSDSPIEVETLGAEDKGLIVSDKIVPEKKEEAVMGNNPFINRFATEDDALGYLADILVEAYLKQKNYESTKHTN
jgi:hypothetical protein